MLASIIGESGSYSRYEVLGNAGVEETNDLENRLGASNFSSGKWDR